MDNRLKKIYNYFNISHQLGDFKSIHESIEGDVVFKGTNLWILILAIFVASVGLNVNSTAVIIGAMLISPLMGPINGMGYSIATYNFPLFRKAIKNFSFAVLASLVTSTIYFTISPLSTAHSELLARTSPSIYDVLIAFFGGLAGIIAISSKQKGNVIPGVAIATALMPPLCTAGYGLATLQFNFFFGAFYLFTINTVFIALASLMVCQFLKFPIYSLIQEERKKSVNRIITAVILLTIIPSIIFGIRLIQQENFTKKANMLIAKVNVLNGNYLLKSRIDAHTKTIDLTYGGTPLTYLERDMVRKEVKELALKKTNINFKQGFAYDNTANITEIEYLKSEINKLRAMEQENSKITDSLNTRQSLENNILVNLHDKYPQIISCQFSRKIIVSEKGASTKHIPVIKIITAKKRLTPKERKEINLYLQSVLQSNEIEILY